MLRRGYVKKSWKHHMEALWVCHKDWMEVPWRCYGSAMEVPCKKVNVVQVAWKCYAAQWMLFENVMHAWCHGGLSTKVSMQIVTLTKVCAKSPWYFHTSMALPYNLCETLKASMALPCSLHWTLSWDIYGTFFMTLLWNFHGSSVQRPWRLSYNLHNTFIWPLNAWHFYDTFTALLQCYTSPALLYGASMQLPMSRW